MASRWRAFVLPLLLLAALEWTARTVNAGSDAIVAAVRKLL